MSALFDIYVDAKRLNPGQFRHTMTILPNAEVSLGALFDGKIVDGARYVVACGDEGTAIRLRKEARELVGDEAEEGMRTEGHWTP